MKRTISPNKFKALADEARREAGVNEWKIIPVSKWWQSIADPDTWNIQTPVPRTKLLLMVHVHECGHVFHKHRKYNYFLDSRKRIEALHEREAWAWCFRKFRQWGLMDKRCLLVARLLAKGYTQDYHWYRVEAVEACSKFLRFAEKVPTPRGDLLSHITKLVLKKKEEFMQIENTKTMKVEADGIMPRLFDAANAEQAIKFFEDLRLRGERHITRSILQGTKWQCVEFTAS